MTTDSLAQLNESIAEVSARIDALQSGLSQRPAGQSMNPNLPARRNDRGLVSGAKVRAYRIACTATTTTRSLHQHQLTRTVAGLNELDARVNLGKTLRKEGLYLQHVLEIREAKA